MLLVGMIKVDHAVSLGIGVCFSATAYTIAGIVKSQKTVFEVS